MTAVATRAEARAALEKTFVEKWMPDIQKYASPRFPADRVLVGVIGALIKNEQLLGCTKASLQLAIYRTARLQLDIGEGIHLVPFGDKCEAIPDYRGMIAVATRQRLVKMIDATPVNANDHFAYERGTDPKLVHRPAPGTKRGPLIGAYAIIETPNSARLHAHWLDIEDIEKRRAKSRSWGPDNVKSCPAWYAMKSVIRDWLGRQPLTGALAEIVAAEEAEFTEVTADGEVVDHGGDPELAADARQMFGEYRRDTLRTPALGDGDETSDAGAYE